MPPCESTRRDVWRRPNARAGWSSTLTLKTLTPCICSAPSRIRKGLHTEAVELVREAIAQNGDVPQFHNTLRAALRAAGHFQEALAAYERALSLDPEYLCAHVNMGNVLVCQGQYVRAAEKYRDVISLDPACVEGYNSLAVALQYEGEYDAVVATCRQALRPAPDDARIYNTMASVFMRQGHCTEAIETYEHALQLKPDYAEAHCNLGMTLLLSGRLKEGWAEYRWRVHTGNGACSRRFDGPRWDGSSFEGKRLVVHFEQGFGGNIQFIRYLPMVKRHGSTVIYEKLRPLAGLSRGFPGIDELAGQIVHKLRLARALAGSSEDIRDGSAHDTLQRPLSPHRPAEGGILTEKTGRDGP